MPKRSVKIPERGPLPTQAYVALARAAERFNHEVGQLCKDAGLTLPQYNALRILRGAGAAGLPCGMLGQRMLHPVPDVTRLLDRLEQRRYIRRERQTDDRRVVRAWITPTGKEALAPIDKPMNALHAEQFGMLNAKERQHLLDLLVRLYDRED